MTARHAPEVTAYRLAPASIIEDAIEAWRDADKATWTACRLSWEAHEAGYTYAEIGAFVGRDGDTVGLHASAWDLRRRLSDRIDPLAVDYLASKLSVSHFRHAASWERNVMRWLTGADKTEREFARVEHVDTAEARERKAFSWLNDCINREDDTVKSSRGFQAELSAHMARLAGRDEGRATFTTLESWLPKLDIFATMRIDSMSLSEQRRGILREIADTTRRLVALMAEWRQG
jgi:hypothetical protein